MRKAWYPARASEICRRRCGFRSRRRGRHRGEATAARSSWVRGSTCMVCRLRLLTPMSGEAEGGGAGQLGAVVYLAEDVELHAAGLVAQSLQFGVGERGDDEQDGVGGGGAGFENLEWIEDEVLAQAGNRDGGRREGEIFERALEEFLVGEHGERGCSGGFKRAGQRGWIEVRTDESTRGRGLLQLCDDGRAGGRGLAQGGLESAWRVRGGPLLEKRDVGRGAPMPSLRAEYARGSAQAEWTWCVLSEESLVPKGGLEPPHPCEYMDLNHARLPIPPLRHLSSMSRTLRQDTALVSFQSFKRRVCCQLRAASLTLERLQTAPSAGRHFAR